MSLSPIVAFERKALFTQGTARLLLAVSLVISLYAVQRGHAQRQSMLEAQEEFREEHREASQKWRARLAAVEAGEVEGGDDPWAGLAMGFRSAAVLPPGPLADLSVGASDVGPNVAGISQWATADRVFGTYQYESPLALAAGPFDLAFVAIFILPLVMIFLSYDVLAGDKESGQLALILAQPVELRSLIASRLGVRLGGVIAIFLGVSVLGLIVGALGSSFDVRTTRFAVWLGLGLLYLGWWSMLLAWIISQNRSSGATVLIMVGLWALICLVAPNVISGASEALYPSPSRLELLSEVRKESSLAYQSRSDLLDGISLEHPDLSTDSYDLPEYIRTAYLVSRTVDAKVRPRLEQFETVQTHRRAFLSLVQYASPAVVALHGFTTAAGTDIDRQKAFERDVVQHKETLARRLESQVLVGRRLTLTEVDAMPTFTFAEAPAVEIFRRVLPPVLYLLLSGLLFMILARQRLARLQTRIRET